MAWERLKAKTSKRTAVPAISVMKSGRVAWNFGTHEALGRPEFVELLLDRAGKRLGLRKAERSEDVFQVRQAGRQKTWGISAFGTLNTENVLVKAAYRRYAKVQDDVAFIDISDIFK